MLGVMGGPTKKQAAEYLKRKKLDKKLKEDAEIEEGIVGQTHAIAKTDGNFLHGYASKLKDKLDVIKKQKEADAKRMKNPFNKRLGRHIPMPEV
jgi:hypothetical protein